MTGFHTARIVSLAVLAAVVGLPAATAAAPAAAATTYTITDLGSLGLGETVGSAINATGQVTGYSYLSTLVPTPACPPVYGNNKKPQPLRTGQVPATLACSRHVCFGRCWLPRPARVGWTIVVGHVAGPLSLWRAGGPERMD